jgi:hypothetical protein
MKWFDRWLAKKVRQAWENAGNEPVERDYDAQAKLSKGKYSNRIGGQAARPVPDRHFEKRGMTFTVYQANGGYAVEYIYYDDKADENHNRLHIIPADKDLGESIGRIIDYEMMMK